MLYGMKIAHGNLGAEMKPVFLDNYAVIQPTFIMTVEREDGRHEMGVVTPPNKFNGERDAVLWSLECLLVWRDTGVFPHFAALAVPQIDLAEDPCVKAVRQHGVIGKGTCSNVDECVDDWDIYAEALLNNWTPEQTVDDYVELHTAHREHERECAWEGPDAIEDHEDTACLDDSFHRHEMDVE